MATYTYSDLGDTSSLYGHQNRQALQPDQIDSTYLDFMTTNMQNNINKPHQNSLLRHNPSQSFPPIDGILYSPIDDCFQFPDFQTDDSLGLQTLFNESPLMSTLERQDDSTLTPTSCSSHGSPHHDHVNVEGWQPTPEMKRTRSADADTKSACWTSPLCPAFGKPGPHPTPSTCGDGCAPNTFDDKAMDQWLEDFAKANDATLATNAPSTTSMLDSLDGTSDILSMSYPELESIKEEEPEEVFEEPTTSSRMKKRPSRRISESSSSPEPLPTLATKAAAAKPSRRQPHNEIEKKYRESINTHLEALKDSIPAFQVSNTNQCMHGKVDIEDLAAAPKPSKSIILASAVAHIKKVEKEKRQLEQERNLLRQQVKALQAMVKSGCDDCSVVNYFNGLNGLNLGLNNNGRGIGRVT